MAGIVQDGGKFNWACDCGAAGTPSAFRDTARAEYKEHRKKCSIAKTTTGDPPIMSTTAKENTIKKQPKAAKTTKGEKKGGRPRGKAVSDADAKAVLARLKEGKTTLIAESKKLGFTHNGPLRAALRTLIGADKYAALMQSTEKPAKKATKAATPKKKETKAVKTPAKAATKKAPTKKSTKKKPTTYEKSAEPETPATSEPTPIEQQIADETREVAEVGA